MSLVLQLAERLLENHPERAARVLESADLQESARIVAAHGTPLAAALVRSLAPRYAAALLASLDPARGAAVLEQLNSSAAARLLRGMPEATREALLDGLAPRHARALRSLLRFAPESAGALLDPWVLALPEDVSAREALRRVREAAAETGYNLYVVDREQRLVGAVNLRELFLARPRSPLSDVMIRDPLRVPAAMDATALIRHPGWKRVHSLPVVDEQGTYLGAIRYRTLRALEAELSGARPGDADADAGRALGELLVAAAGGLVDALSGAATRAAKGSGRGA
jgi:magnesium transporter